jgi:hypothetical protein
MPKNGMRLALASIHTVQRLGPRTSVQLRMVGSAQKNKRNGSEEAFSQGLRTMVLGEVKWCRALGAGLSLGYRIGIRYYPYY